jgi:hypothetical protein
VTANNMTLSFQTHDTDDCGTDGVDNLLQQDSQYSKV